MTRTAQSPTRQSGDDRSVGELVDVATIQVSRLVRGLESTYGAISAYVGRAAEENVELATNFNFFG